MRVSYILASGQQAAFGGGRVGVDFVIAAASVYDHETAVVRGFQPAAYFRVYGPADGY